MALDAAHRASIYEKLRPVLGDEDANILMSEFPSIEAQELVTKDFLRAELAELKSTMLVWLGSGIAASTALLAAIGLLSLRASP